MSDPNGDPCYDVANELFRSILPQPLNDRKMDEEKVSPLFPVHWREKLATDGLGDKLQTKVLYLERRNTYEIGAFTL